MSTCSAFHLSFPSLFHSRARGTLFLSVSLTISSYVYTIRTYRVPWYRIPLHRDIYIQAPHSLSSPAPFLSHFLCLSMSQYLVIAQKYGGKAKGTHRETMNYHGMREELKRTLREREKKRSLEIKYESCTLKNLI